jgi:hypothetical protein
MYHDGANTWFENQTGDLTFRNSANDKGIVFQSDNGAGGTATYFKLDGGTSTHDGSATTALYTNWPDKSIISIGNSHDLQIYHNGSNSYIDDTGTGSLYIRGANDVNIRKYTGEQMIKAIADGAVEIFHNNVKKFETTSGGITVTGTVTANGTTLTGNTGDMLLGTSQDITAHKEFQNNIQARFGSDNDMLIQHTGSHGYWDCETGNMYLRAEADNSHIYLQADDGSGGNTTYIDINGNNERITMMKPVKMDQRRFALTTSTDGNHQGDVVFFGGTSTTVGKIYYYTSSGTWAETNAHAVGTADGLLAVALGSSSDTDGMLLRGMVTLNHDPGTIGDPIYLDEANNGQAHSSIPAGTGDIVRIVGYCVHNTQGRIWFNPDNTFIEVA